VTLKRLFISKVKRELRKTLVQMASKIGMITKRRSEWLDLLSLPEFNRREDSKMLEKRRKLRMLL
jgi:hypothetical protein